jgi:DNA-binding CsgD family transcriptional regulator
MAAAKSLAQVLDELRRVTPARFRRAPRQVEVVSLLERLLGASRLLGVEERAGGIAFRLECEPQGKDAAATFLLTCVLHQPTDSSVLTTAEQAVGAMLSEGRTLAQIAQLRGVSANTVKTQVRQIFRKLNVESRVALVRRLCP